MRWLLLLVLLFPSEAEAKAPWRAERVAVRDYTSSAWTGIVETQVAAINAIMPPRAPTFVYERHEHRSCGSLGPQRGAIVVCESDVEIACWADSLDQGAVTCHHPVRKQGAAATIRLGNWWHRGDVQWMRYMACHELMHATTWVADTDVTQGDTSCVHGWSPVPGPWDAELARKAYTKRHR
jgi:hypothetical protein